MEIKLDSCFTPETREITICKYAEYVNLNIKDTEKNKELGITIFNADAIKLRQFLPKPDKTKKAKKSRWIPVSEGLPDNSLLVLFYDALSYGVLYGTHTDTVPRWHSSGYLYFDGEGYSRITHWMLLPEAPKMER